MGLRKKKSLIDQASDYVETVRPQFESAIDTAVETARDAAKDARDRALPLLADARDKAGPYLADARDKAGPALADARDKAAPYLADARAKAAPVVAAGAALAADKASAGRDLASAKVAQLKGEPAPKKGGKLKKILLISGIAAALGLVAKKLQGDSASDNWQTSYVPAPAPAAAKPAAPAAPVTPAAPASGAADSADDTGGSSPDEALADQVEAPHPVSTPDEPAEVVSIDDAPSKGDDKA